MEHLVCMESPLAKVNRAFEDPVFLRDNRVLQNLLLTEDKYIPTACYFNCVQKDIQPYMRKMVAEWMAEVCAEQNMEEEVFPLAMNYLDRFLCVHSLHRTRLQCLGAACMFLASKLKESYHISAEQLVIYTDRSINLTDLREMESLILHVLKWDLSAVTPYDFLVQIVSRLPLNPAHVPTVKKHSQTFMALCATDCRFMLYPPSMIAAGCIGAAIKGLLGSRIEPHSLLDQLYKVTGIEVDCLRPCQELIENLIKTSLSSLAQQSTDSETPTKSHPMKEQSTTPTDVRDINLMAIDMENSYIESE